MSFNNISLINLNSQFNPFYSSITIDSSGNVGVGKTNPTTNLDVSGNIKLSGIISGSGANLTSLNANYITDGVLSVRCGGTGASTLTPGYILVGNGTSTVSQPTNLFWDNTSNRLGIGKNVPSTTLDVNGTITSTGLICSGGALVIDATNNVNIDSGVLYIDAAKNNVGIGTILPDADTKLHVSGNARIEGNLKVNGTLTQVNTVQGTTEQLNITNDGTGPAVTINQTGAQDILNIQDDSATCFKIRDGGHVNIGTVTKIVDVDISGNLKLSGIITGSGSGISNIPYFNLINKVTVGNGLAITFGSTTSSPVITTNFSSGTGIVINTAVNPITIGATYASSDLINIFNSTYFENITSLIQIKSSWKPTTAAAADTAKKLATPVNIAGVSFDGSIAISVPYFNLTNKPTAGTGISITPGSAILGPEISATYASSDLVSIFNPAQFVNNGITSKIDLTSSSLSKWTPGTGLIYYNSGNVGIGITNPSVPLSVYTVNNTGGIKITGGTGATGDQWWLGYGHSGGATPSTDSNDRARIGVNILAGGSGRLFFTTGAAGAQAERMRIDEVGYVGINNLLPATHLDVLSANTYIAQFRHTNLTQGIGIGYDTIAAIAPTAQSIRLAAKGATGSVILMTNAIDRMTINSDGNVGIGKTPNTILDVNGTITATTFSGSGSSLTGLPAANISGTLTADKGGTGCTSLSTTFFDTTGGILSLKTISSQWTTLSNNIYFNSANVGIGTTNPLSLLDINAANYTGAILTLDAGIINATTQMPRSIGKPLMKIGKTSFSTTAGDYYGIGFGYSPTSTDFNCAEIGTIITSIAGKETGDIVFSTRPDTTNVAATERMRILSSGNVGIGKTPGYLLDVNGTINASEFRVGGSVLTGWATTGNNYTTASLGIGTATINERLTISGTASRQIMVTCTTATSSSYMGFSNSANDSLAYIGVDGVGLTNIVYGALTLGTFKDKPILFTTGASSTEKMRIDSGGNIGIGVTNPISKFQIVHSSTSTNADTAPGAGLYVFNPTNATSNNSIICNRIAGNLANKVIYSYDVSTQYGWSTYILGSDTTNRLLRFHSAWDGTSGVDRMVINGANGNVGINTIDPQASLDIVKSTAVATTADLLNMRFDGNWGLKLQQNYSVAGNIQYNFIHKYNSTDYNSLTFKGANVGIGTTSPTQILQVGAGGRLRIANDNTDYSIIGCDDAISATNTRIVISGSARTGNLGNIDYVATSTGIHRFFTTSSTTERMRIVNNGNVGIGTTDPQRPLHTQTAIRIGGTGAALDFGDDLTTQIYRNATTSEIRFTTNTTDRLVINSSGNVGIGTTNPTTAKLVISGTAGAIGLDMSTADQYAEMRVIRNSKWSVDKDMFIQYDAGTGSRLRLFSNNVETMVLYNSCVGIGITNPTSKLHLYDDITTNTKLIIQNNLTTLTPSSGITGQITGSNDRYMIFTTGTSTFTVPTGGIVCDILMIGGGGGGGKDGGGGGGAGACIVAINNVLNEGSYLITVGDGGNWSGGNGGDSIISINSIEKFKAKGGGFGGNNGLKNNQPGGCGGGGIFDWTNTRAGGATVNTNIITLSNGTTITSGPTIQSTYAIFGNKGGDQLHTSGTPTTAGLTSAGGGGIGTAGVNHEVNQTSGSAGGNGLHEATIGGNLYNFRSYFANNITFGVNDGTGKFYIGGGGGGVADSGQTRGSGGLGGGGNNTSGYINTGSGGAGNNISSGYNGGSGIVIIRYRTLISSSSIELNRGTVNDSNTDYKIGNYNGDFKIISSLSGTDTDRFTMNLSGLTVPLTVTATIFSGSGASLTNLNATNISDGTLTVARGGTGAATLVAGQILIGNDADPLSQSSKLVWNNTNSILDVNGSIKSTSLICSGGAVVIDISNNVNIDSGVLYIDGTKNNVGIGTILPDSDTKLHVSGNARIEGNLKVNGTFEQVNTVQGTTEQLKIKNDGTGPAVIINQTGTQDILDIQDDSVTCFKIRDGGHVNIGTVTKIVDVDISGNLKLSGIITGSGAGLSNIPYFNLINKITVGTGLSITQGSTTSSPNITLDLTESSIPSLPISKITGLDTSLNNIPYFNLINKITVGTGLAITTGSSTTSPNITLSLTAALIPELATSKITGLDAALTAKQATINSTVGQLIIGNGNGVTTTSTGLTWTTDTNLLSATNLTISGATTHTGTSIFTGNVGIGTSVVATNVLQVGTSGRLRISNGATDYTLIGTIDADGVNNTKILLSGIDRGGATLGGNIEYYASAVGQHIFYTTASATERMRIASGGNVAIGTTDTATYKLNVNGSMNATDYKINGLALNIGALSQGMTVQTKHLTYTQMDVKNNTGWDAINDDLATGFVIAITPASISSKILVNMIAHIGTDQANDARWWGIKLYRKIGAGAWTEITGANGTGTGAAAITTGTPVWISHNLGMQDANYSFLVANVTGTYLDAPNTTSIVYYTAYWNQRVGDNPSVTGFIYLNRVMQQGNILRPAPSSSWTVSEIWDLGTPYTPPVADTTINIASSTVAIGTTPNVNYKLNINQGTSGATGATCFPLRISAGAFSTSGNETATLLGLGTENNITTKCAIGHCRTSTNDIGSIVFLCNNSADATNATMTDERMRITSTGFVGIGTISPSSRLTINNIVNDRNAFDHSESPLTITHPTATSTTVLNDPKTVLHLCRQGTTGQSFGAKASFKLCRWENNTTNSRTRLDITLANALYDDVNIISMRSDGNIGIGITNPTQILQVGGGGRLRIANTNSDYTIIGSDDNDGASNTRIVLSGINRTSYNGNIDYLAPSTGQHAFYTTTSQTERMRIGNNGNVSINSTDTATYKLNVNGTIFVAGQINLPITIDCGIIWNGDAALGRASLATNYSTSAAAGDIILRSAAANKIILQSGSGAGAIVIATTNNVGIGKTDPGTKLDVVGTVTATLFSGSGASLTLLNATNISTGTLTVAQGGTGCTSLNTTVFDTSGGILSLKSGSAISSQWTTLNNNIYFNTANVGIGITNPNYKLHVEDGILFVGDSSYINSLSLNVANNYYLLFDNTYNGTMGSGIAANKIRLMNDTSNNILAGFGMENNSIAYYSGTLGSHTFYSGTTSSNYGTGRFQIDQLGNITCTGDFAAFTSISDKRLKTNIIKLDSSIDIIKNLNPVKFNWKYNDFIIDNKQGKEDVGFIAQEIEQIIPLATGEYKVINSEETYKNIKYERIIPYLVKSIQELIDKVERLEQEIQYLKQS